MDDPAPAPSSLADQQWPSIFQDETLQALIARALEHGDDIRLAAARIAEAQARLGITRADEFPSVGAGVSEIAQRTSRALGFGSRTVAATEVQASAAWQLDFWGRYRRATEAARADLLATEWGRRAVMTTLVSDVADAYFRLRMLDLSLDVSQRTLESRQESLRLTQVREQGGVTTLMDVRQAEQLVYGAQAEIVTLERQIEQEENFISVLLGDNPGPIGRGRSLTDQPQPASVPAGLPSAARPFAHRSTAAGVGAGGVAIGAARTAS
jgi:multidrug efflux system outer membrane protein